MANFDSILSDASQLPIAERLQLIEALWHAVPDESLPELDAEWLTEINRRRQSTMRVWWRASHGKRFAMNRGVERGYPMAIVFVRYLPDARLDLNESYDWYEKRSDQTSRRFLEAVEAALNRVIANRDGAFDEPFSLLPANTHPLG